VPLEADALVPHADERPRLDGDLEPRASVERLVSTAAPDTDASIASVEIIQTLCSGS
jgi:hypothetical protein